jgi:hypothetical protein
MRAVNSQKASSRPAGLSANGLLRKQHHQHRNVRAGAACQAPANSILSRPSVSRRASELLVHGRGERGRLDQDDATSPTAVGCLWGTTAAISQELFTMATSKQLLSALVTGTDNGLQEVVGFRC